MNTIDLIIFIAYCLLILSVGLFVSRGKKGDERDAGDYFLAGRRLAWWAIGASIIASNISAEQFVGMSGSGYAIGLAAFAGIYSIYGGLKAVALTDVVQVVFLVGGGLVTTYIALDLLGEGDGVYQGMVNLYGEASDKFHLILDKSHPGYKDLPGISVILGGLWVANLYYWGCNQYIIQRALAAKSVREAQNGMLFAGFIKLFIPLLVVIPGIAAFALYVDNGYNGLNFNRPAFSLMQQDMSDGRISKIVATSLDRISRNSLDVLAFADYAVSTGISLETINGDHATLDWNRQLYAALAAKGGECK